MSLFFNLTQTLDCTKPGKFIPLLCIGKLPFLFQYLTYKRFYLTKIKAMEAVIVVVVEVLAVESVEVVAALVCLN